MGSSASTNALVVKSVSRKLGKFVFRVQVPAPAPVRFDFMNRTVYYVSMTLEADIRRLRLDGKTYSEIALLLECSKATISYYLGAGQKEKNDVRRIKLRNSVRQYIQQVKTDSVCTDCGENYPYWVLQFDHTGTDKEFTIAKFAAGTLDLERIKKEIAKCEVVCANCHADRTYGRLLK